jgi:hypothetical protein
LPRFWGPRGHGGQHTERPRPPLQGPLLAISVPVPENSRGIPRMPAKHMASYGILRKSRQILAETFRLLLTVRALYASPALDGQRVAILAYAGQRDRGFAPVKRFCLGAAGSSQATFWLNTVPWVTGPYRATVALYVDRHKYIYCIGLRHSEGNRAPGGHAFSGTAPGKSGPCGAGSLPWLHAPSRIPSTSITSSFAKRLRKLLKTLRIPA